MTSTLPSMPEADIPNAGGARARAGRAYQQTTEPKQEPKWDLVKAYLPLVKSIVSRMRIYFPDSVDVEDIYSVALGGIITASRNYDPEKSKAFGPYAALRIRGALLDELRRLDWMPRIARINLKKYQRAVEELEGKLHREAGEADIEEALSITPEEQRKLRESRQPVYLVPLDCPVVPGDDETPALHETISDLTQKDGRDVAEDHEVLELLRDRLEALPEIPRKVLAMYYLEGLRLAEIAEVFGLTESRICQIHSQALNTLRGHLSRLLKR